MWYFFMCLMISNGVMSIREIIYIIIIVYKVYLVFLNLWNNMGFLMVKNWFKFKIVMVNMLVVIVVFEIK